MEHVREPRPEKVSEVTGLVEKFGRAKSVFLTDFTGLNVADVTELRRKFRENKIEYVVVKNTLARRGAEQLGMQEILPYLDGPTALAFGYDDPASPARVLATFLKNHPKPEVKACFIDGDVFPGGELEAISKWPSREELLAKLVGQLNAPIYGLVMTLGGITRKLLYALNAVKDQKEKQ